MRDNRKPDDFIAEFDIVENNRRHTTPPLRFIDPKTETLKTEILRNDIWVLWLEKYPIDRIAKTLGCTSATVKKHLKKCKEMYDKWVTENGLTLHGDPANRLEDTLRDLIVEAEELEVMAQECRAEGDIRGYKEMKKLKLDTYKEIAKFKGVEPPKRMDVNMSSAEETRRKMAELFPSDEVIDPEEEDKG